MNRLTGVVCDVEVGSIKEDPHMRHFIEEHGKYICYDLIINSNFKILLFRDNLLNISIAGQMRDDFYFGNILIYNHLFNYTIRADKVWIIDERIYYDYHELLIRFLSKDECLIKLGKNEFFIRKMKNIFGLSFLNFLIYELEINDNVGGLIGDISRKKYIFYENIQENLKGAISINGKIFDAQITKGEASSCWHITPKAAFYPKQLNDYVMM